MALSDRGIGWSALRAMDLVNSRTRECSDAYPTEILLGDIHVIHVHSRFLLRPTPFPEVFPHVVFMPFYMA